MLIQSYQSRCLIMAPKINPLRASTRNSPTTPTSPSSAMPPRHDGYPSFWFVFSVLVLLRTVTSRLSSVVADCDETFNYWEPTHYLMYGYGFQTWEYRYAATRARTHTHRQPRLMACIPALRQPLVCHSIVLVSADPRDDRQGHRVRAPGERQGTSLVAASRGVCKCTHS